MAIWSPTVVYKLWYIYIYILYYKQHAASSQIWQWTTVKINVSFSTKIKDSIGQYATLYLICRSHTHTHTHTHAHTYIYSLHYKLHHAALSQFLELYFHNEQLWQSMSHSQQKLKTCLIISSNLYIPALENICMCVH